VLDPAAASEPVPPPYLKHRPKVVLIDVGRQLFVDDFLIEDTTLTRQFHQPVKRPDNPVLRPETAWEQGRTHQPMSAPFSDGAFFEPRTRQFRLWYMAGWFDGTALAVSRDGLRWERPALDVFPETNLVVKTDPHWRRDGVSVWLDHEATRPDERYKMFLYARSGELGKKLESMPGGNLLASPDGIHWTLRGRTGPTRDNTTFFYNPFRKVWVFSHRTRYKIDGATPRTRGYTEHRDFFDALGETWKKNPPVFWARSDAADPPDPEIGYTPELYKIDAVAYESVLLGLFEVLYGPSNGVCAKRGEPKATDLQIAFSRDGFHWDRRNRRPFLAASRQRGNWERGYLTSAGGCCLVVGDQLHFYYGAFQGDQAMTTGDEIWTGMYAKASSGLATLRRDGFASMNAGAQGGTLTTPPIAFQGAHLFVNVDNPQGELRVEVQDEAGSTLLPFTKEDCIPVAANNTLQNVRWKNTSDLCAVSRRPVKFRFHLTTGRLYAFWVSRDATGRSDGYVAGGGPGYTGPTDTVGRAALETEQHLQGPIDR
jgi:hypothetical protein